MHKTFGYIHPDVSDHRGKGLKNILLHVSDKGPNLPVHLLVGNPMASMSPRCLFLAHC